MLQKIGQWFTEDNGQVAIYDANNITVEARHELRDYFKDMDVHTFFIGLFTSAARTAGQDSWSWDRERMRQPRSHRKEHQSVSRADFIDVHAEG